MPPIIYEAKPSDTFLPKLQGVSYWNNQFWMALEEKENAGFLKAKNINKKLPESTPGSIGQNLYPVKPTF
jgi:hypothetical protein